MEVGSDKIREFGVGVLLGLSLLIGLLGGTITALWINNYPDSSTEFISLGLILLGLGFVATAYILQKMT